MEKKKMLITQALDEKALLVKKIRNKIELANLIDVKKRNEEKVYFTKENEEEFKKNALASYQQIMDLIDRYQKIEAAIIYSNANTQVETSYGIMSVAAAISMRNRLRECDKRSTQDSFEYFLEKQMQNNYTEALKILEQKNQMLQTTADNMRLSILGKEKQGKDDTSLEVVEIYVKENLMELVDPLGMLRKMEKLKQKRETLLAELDTMIKISNATTYIEI